MTLGRSSTGAIKIKTDGGLRAVECACCGGCGCDLQIKDPLLSVLRSATTGTCNGVGPTYFNAQGGGFEAIFELPGFIFYSVSLSANAPCLTIQSLDFNEIRAVSDPSCCPSSIIFDSYCTPAGNMTVNGIEFDAVNIIYDASEPLIPPAEFLFS
jgi:hypothetical protein